MFSWYEFKSIKSLSIKSLSIKTFTDIDPPIGQPSTCMISLLLIENTHSWVSFCSSLVKIDFLQNGYF